VLAPRQNDADFDRVRANNRQIAALAAKVLEAKIAARICPAIASNKTVAAVYNLARSDRRIAASVEQWDSNPWLLNTPTGVVDLRNGQLRTHQLSDYMTKMTLVGPAPAGSDASVWSGFLDRIFARDPGLIAFVQRAVGYALTGSVRDHAIFFMYGTGANGKSVLVNTVRAMLGAYATSVPMDALTITPYPSHPTELADLAGARLVYASETEGGRRWAEARIKQLTGGDPIKARKMRQDFFEYQPQFKLFVAGNHKPSLTNVNEAIRRRLHLIPFDVTIPPAEQDRDLTDKLASELPVILSWAIRGCLEWQRIGLSPPSKVSAATNDYLAGEDTLAQWIGECCSTEPNDTSTSAVLFANWKSYAERAQERAGSQKSFVLRLEERKFKRWRCPKTDRRGFSGIRTIDQDLGVNRNATEANDNDRGSDVP
jgi:putative DNA primase/helicase